jgi:hypothetical protein
MYQRNSKLSILWRGGWKMRGGRGFSGLKGLFELEYREIGVGLEG